MINAQPTRRFEFLTRSTYER
ncbi:protein of unknown function [Azospirillum baldaniorum]|uniref:Uncharacterized protein n=1 Tax=Azospirillum baldaniorum TaxID=1064539 RepID=A0A9P1NMC5_9PROT|nr:protein of unknown function [Azospirillum baldaniorum]